MLGIDLAILVGVGALVVFAASLGGRSLGDRLERRRREQQGRKNAEQERRRLEERCTVCGEPVDPATDLFERDQWWHRACWRDVVS